MVGAFLGERALHGGWLTFNSDMLPRGSGLFAGRGQLRDERSMLGGGAAEVDHGSLAPGVSRQQRLRVKP